MIDTIKIRSPYLSEHTAEQVSSMLVTRSAFNNDSGELLYELVSGALKGSFDHRVSVRVCRDEVVYLPPRHPGQKGTTELRECRPYVFLEGSVHKALLGHNVFGGPCSLLPAARWFVGHVGKLLHVIFPPADDWLLYRVDWAECFELGSYEACEDFVRGMNRCNYPRRQPRRYGWQSIVFAGTYTTWKLYHKGPEFSKNDYSRLIHAGVYNAVQWQEKAGRILRSETTIKAPKLKRDFNGYPKVKDVSDEYIAGVHDQNTARVLREGEAEMKTVRTAEEVTKRLHSMYSERQASALFCTWTFLGVQEEQLILRFMSRRTFYHHKKLLREAGVSWTGTDVIIQKDSLIPEGFSPVRTDPRRLIDEAPEVSKALAPFTVAV